MYSKSLLFNKRARLLNNTVDELCPKIELDYEELYLK